MVRSAGRKMVLSNDNGARTPKTKLVMLVDRQLQNEQGKKIADFKAYFDSLLRRVGYVKAKQIMRTECHIFVCVK